MTKEITKAFILQEMQDKFKLRELEPEVFSFLETVIPVYNIEQHLKKTEIETKTLSVTAIGGMGFIQVPFRERWAIQRYNVIFLTGSYTVAGVLVFRPTLGTWMYLDLAAAQNTSYANDLPKECILQPADQIGINIDGYTSTGDLELRLDVVKEEIR